MARKPTPTPAIVESTINEAKLADLQQANHAMAVVDFEGQESLIALAQQFGYKDALTVGALEDGIRFYQQRTAEACMELGKRLVLLKEATAHGEFKLRLEFLDIEYGAAVRFMGVATKFSKMPTSALLKAANSQSKLIELLVLDDSEIVELEDGGTVRGITVDDVDRMGVRELRTNLRDARKEQVATEKRLAELHKFNDKESMKALPPVHELVAGSAARALGVLQGELRDGFEKLVAHHKQHGQSAVDGREVMQGYVAQIQQTLNDLREAFVLGDTIGDGTPAWKKWAAANPIAG